DGGRASPPVLVLRQGKCYLFDLKTAEPALLFCTGERSCRQVVNPDARSLPGLLPCVPHRVRSRFGVLSMPAGSDRFSLPEISPPAGFVMHWIQARAAPKSVIGKGNLLSETFVRLRALIDCGRHKGRRSVFHVQNLCSCLLIVPGTGCQHGGLQRGKCRGAGSGC